MRMMDYQQEEAQRIMHLLCDGRENIEVLRDRAKRLLYSIFATNNELTYFAEIDRRKVLRMRRELQ